MYKAVVNVCVENVQMWKGGSFFNDISFIILCLISLFIVDWPLGALNVVVDPKKNDN